MKKPEPDSTDSELIKIREKGLTENLFPPVDNSLPPYIKELIEELRTHQAELEMQNEEIRNAYSALVRAKEIYMDLYESSPVGYFTIDEDCLIYRLNLAGSELFGLERNRLLGRRFTQFLSPDSIEPYCQHFRSCVETRKKQTCELMLKSKDENQRYINIESLAVTDDEGQFSRVRTAVIEVTNYKLAEKKIKALSRELLVSHEAERQMISRELHDRIAQDLSAAKMGCDTLMISDPPITVEVKNRISSLSKILHNTILSVRDLSYDLRPPSLEKGDISAALSSCCSEFSLNTGIEVGFLSTGMENVPLDFFVMVNIYRLVQEALNNVRKHAEAGHVDVTFAYIKPDLLLRIIDNGIGFDVGKRLESMDSEKRMGLRSMEERVKLLGGTMQIQSKPGAGTKIFIRLLKE